MRRKRVLVVDDSVVVRQSLSEALARTPEIIVVGSAASGRIALMKIPLLFPDVIALAMDMPEMSGLQTLAVIRTRYPTLPVIMLSPSAGAGRAGLVDARALGAVASIIKPILTPGSGNGRERLGAELAASIMKYCPEEPCFPAITPEPPTGTTPAASDRRETRVDVLVIAVSTGGPSALMELIPSLPRDFPIPILIVQHMPPSFTTLLAERLASRSSVCVVEGSANHALGPGCAFVAPGDFHMAVVRDGDAVRLTVHQEPPENSCRPAADVLFRSVARVYGRHVLAVVMTGMGRDGLIGCERIRAAGGQILVQDKESSVVWGMPSFVVKAGLADRVLPLSALGAEIVRRAWNHRRKAAAPTIAAGLCAPQGSEGVRR
jgi:two-component system, chemotaxis family, protein-glutamate methylesterase/glutaminase